MRSAAAAILGIVATVVAIMNCGSEESTEPTQIVVSVDTTTSECALIQKTLVRVDTFDDHAPSAGEKAGCDKASSHIGEFVLVPKAADDAEVQFQVVTGVDRNPDECHADDSVDCIFVKRVARFIPHQTLRLSVLMSGACRGKTCKGDDSCNDNGQCVSPTGSSGSVDVDAGGTPTPKVDAGPPTPREKCEASGCLDLNGGSCSDDGVCKATCGSGQQCNFPCPSGIACVFQCAKGNCQSITCTDKNPSCAIECQTSGACNTITCKSDKCTITCASVGEESPRSCSVINVGSKSAPTIDCGDRGCGTLNCNGPAACQCTDKDPSDCNAGSSSSSSGSSSSGSLCNDCHHSG